MNKIAELIKLGETLYALDDSGQLWKFWEANTYQISGRWIGSRPAQWEKMPALVETVSNDVGKMITVEKGSLGN